MDKLFVSSEAYKIFHHAGWHNYFQKLQGYVHDIAKEFSQAFVQDNVIIRGITFLVIVQIVAIVINFPQIGELYIPITSTRVTELKTGRTNFLQHNESPEVIKGQGALRKSLPPPWDEVAQFIGQYITCEGHFNFIHAHHLWLMLHLRLGHLINIPYYMYHSLKRACSQFREGHENSLEHHDLIKLLVLHGLQLQEAAIAWDVFIQLDLNTTKLQLGETKIMDKEQPSKTQNQKKSPTYKSL